MAVGTYTKPSGAGVTLAEQWNGSKWRVQPTPSLPGAAWSNLFGVSCVSPSACEAVGATTSTSGAQKNLAERWNGSSWQIQSTPTPAGGGQLNGVSCTSPSACTAVGGTPPGTPRKTLVERWNGSSWQIQSAPSPPGAFLSDVACTSSAACTAVGGSNAGTLAERWDGTAWSTQTTANPPKGGGALFSVACTSPSACTAVGASSAGTLAERWNGTHWSIQTTPNPPQGGGLLASVACTSPSACTAAGVYQDSSGAAHPLAERWDGSSWAIQPTPRLPGGAQSQLIDVACTSATGCLAVGYSYPKGGNNIQSPATLAERWDGSTWRVEHTPNPPGPAASILNAASCVSPSACIAVGNTSNSRVASLTLAQRWKRPHLEHPAHPQPRRRRQPDRRLVPVAGVLPGGRGSRQSVHRTGAWHAGRAVGRREVAHPAHAEPPGRRVVPALCVVHLAVGVHRGRRPPGANANRAGHPGRAVERSHLEHPAHPQPARSRASRWERWLSGGTAGRGGSCPRSSPPPPGPTPASTACPAPRPRPVPRSGTRPTPRRWPSGGTAEHGRSRPPPNPPGGQSFLSNVACPTSSACTAVGISQTGSGPLTLAERWSGGRWRIQPTPGLVANDIAPPGVACPTVSACFAVASYTNVSNLTLAEQWNRTGTITQAVTGRPVAPGALPAACLRALPLPPLSASGQTPASDRRWPPAATLPTPASTAQPTRLRRCL